MYPIVIYTFLYVASESATPVMSTSAIVVSSSTTGISRSTAGMSTSMMKTQLMATQATGKIT